MLESIIFKKIINFIQPQLSKSQFGFLRNRSCLSQLLTSLASIYEAVDNRNQVDVLYLDFRKAFDSVPHQELLYKLWQMGITGPLWSWFKCYLSSRSHYVCIDGINSSSLPVRSGVPQGSILGPLLFLIYINDLPNVITNTACYVFADDIKFIKSISCFNDHLQFQQDIISVETWCQTWKLPLNFSKCNSLRFTLAQHQSDDFKYTLNNELVQLAQSQRDLGIITTVNLTWADHYNHVCSKAYRSLNLIRRTISTNSPVNLKKQLYISLVRSHLCYCSQIWRPNLIKDITNIERIQRKATKFILNDYASDYKSRLEALQMLPLTLWFELQDIMFLVKCLQDQTDTLNINRYITFAASNTRAGSSSKLHHHFSRTTTARHFYFSRVARLWNALPSHLIDLTLSFSTIKVHVRIFLWEHFKSHFVSNNIHSFHLKCPCSQCY